MIIVICTNWTTAPIKVANAYVNYIISLIFVNSVMIIVTCTNWPKAPIKVANAYVNYIISLIFVNSGTNLRCLKAKRNNSLKMS